MIIISQMTALGNECRVSYCMWRIRRAAKRIDPHRGELLRCHVQTADPYGLRGELPPEWQCIGHDYFFVDPKGKWAVRSCDIRARHPHISDEEWGRLTLAARERFRQRRTARP